MGLDFNNSSAHWSYGGFNNFRRKVAEYIGLDLNSMKGFGGSLDWKEIKDDVKMLLDHSDCDGYLTPKQCAKVYPRLAEIINAWELPDADSKYSYFYDIQQARLLIEGMRYCAEKNKKLIFC